MGISLSMQLSRVEHSTCANIKLLVIAHPAILNVGPPGVGLNLDIKMMLANIQAGLIITTW